MNFVSNPPTTETGADFTEVNGKGYVPTLEFAKNEVLTEVSTILQYLADKAEGSNLLPKLGSMVWLIPGHCDPTVNLHDMMIGVTGGLRHGTVQRVYRVDARGAMT